MTWDIFCRVIDNFGDIGVCWRLSAELAARGHAVRLWVDDATALHWMAPGALEGAWPGVKVLPWDASLQADLVESLAPADVWIEAFGCEIAPEFLAAHPRFSGVKGETGRVGPVWINLEYLSAQAYVERCHGLPSPVGYGPGKGRVKHFFYPGFSPTTGGLLREGSLWSRQSAFGEMQRLAWLKARGIEPNGDRLVSLFCYEAAALRSLLKGWQTGTAPIQLLVAAGLPSAAVRATGIDESAALKLHYLPPLSQVDYDHLLWCCDLNFVRGEDSLVRALWARKPFVWHIYAQADDAHHAKLEALLNLLDAPDSMREFHRSWNGTGACGPNGYTSFALQNWALDDWQRTVDGAHTRLVAQPDLCEQLIGFVGKNR